MRTTGFVATITLAVSGLLGAAAGMLAAEEAGIVFEGKDGPGKGKHIVLLCGDEEYRSEELIPQLAKILAVHHGFKCTTLFAINRQDGTIDPQTLDNIPGLEALQSADLMVMFLRFRELPDEQMKQIIDYTNSGTTDCGAADVHAPLFLPQTQGQPLRQVQLPRQRVRGGLRPPGARVRPGSIITAGTSTKALAD